MRLTADQNAGVVAPDSIRTYIPEYLMKAGMADEIREAPEAVRRQGNGLARPLAELAARLKRRPPQVVVTCARGSSAHAATFGKHLIERYIGLPVAAGAPNIASVYRQSLQLRDQLFLAISQSGRSDDLVELTISAKASGALTVGLVNATDGPLAAACDILLPVGAGPEFSVAATKTFVATLSALLRLTASWTGDDELEGAIERLPDRLAAASALDWSAALGALADTKSLIAIGRGPTLAIAREASLKLKETCNLHAEAFSGAEFRHGPLALVSSRYPILMFMPTDAAAAGMHQLAADLRRMSTALFVAEPGEAAPGRLPVAPSDHAETDAVCLIQSFYEMCVRLAKHLGTDVDRPRHLQKITRTR
jgi:glutamine---fructose-6-phosphate transaminase (isomerizing)